MHRKPLVVTLLADDSRNAALGRLLDTNDARALVVHSTDEFHQTINQECVDLVVIESRLKGFLTGIEILERMHQDLVRPATILVSEPVVDVERRARKLGVDRILSPHVPLHQLAEEAALLLKTTAQQRVFVPTQARALVQQVGAINPLPQLLLKIASYLDRDDEEVIEDLARDVSVDARVTAEVLKLTNSSAMGRPYKTTNIFDAVRYLGVRRTVAMVLSAGIFRAQSTILRVATPSLRVWYQYRSVLIGSTASSFASALEGISAPTAYLLGLLQDIGMLVLSYVYGPRYDQLLERVNKISHLCREHVEFSEFETDHAQVSAALMQKWELPPSLVAMVLRHHERHSDADRPQVEQAFARVMRIGERVADIVDSRSPKRFLDLNHSLSYYGKAKASECREALSAAINRSVESSRLFRAPPPDPMMVKQLLSELATRCSSDAARVGAAETEETLPESSVAIEWPASWSDDPRSRPRILLVEDEQTIVKLIRKWLDGCPIDVLACTTADEAMRTEDEIDLLICDIYVGDALGSMVIRSLRDRGYSGKVIVISGDARRDTVQRYIELGVNDFLVKPFNRQRLLQSIAHHLPRAAGPRWSQHELVATADEN